MMITKKITRVLLFTLISFSISNAQKITFPLIWKSKSDNKTNFLTTVSSDGSEVIATTRDEICVLQGSDGSKIWSGDLETIAGMKTVDLQKYMEDAGVIFVFNKKSGNDQMVCIDSKTGKQLWYTEKYQGITGENLCYIPELKAFGIYLKDGIDMLDARTGELKWTLSAFKGAIAEWTYFPDTKELLILNYKPNTLQSYFSEFKNQLMLVNAETGAVKWETQYGGVIETKIITREPVVDWMVDREKNKILVQLDGLQVFDLKTGNLVWKAELNMSLYKGTLFNSQNQIYDAVANPLVNGNDVYLVAFSAKGEKKTLKKYDLTTGNLIWTNEEIDDKKTIIPQLSFVDGMIVAQIGGYVNLQNRKTDSNGTAEMSKWEWEGPFGLKAFDASSGKMIWQSEKFKGLVTNLIVNKNNIYVASEESLFKLDYKTGTPAAEIKIKTAKVGEPRKLLDFNDKIVALCQDGIFAINTQNANIEYSVEIKDMKEEYFVRKDNYFMKNKEELMAFDFNTGKIKGIFEFEKGEVKWKLTKDGKFIYLFRKGEGEISKYSTTF